jgi:hypothetical protein
MSLFEADSQYFRLLSWRVYGSDIQRSSLPETLQSVPYLIPTVQEMFPVIGNAVQSSDKRIMC